MKKHTTLKGRDVRRGLFLSILLGSGAIISCGETSPSAQESTPKIANGDAVLPSDPVAWSTVGLVQPLPQGGWTPYCSGTLIEQDLVLTAAHCVSPRVFVSFGLGQVDRSTVIRGTAYAHENFSSPSSPMLTYDIALIRLDRNAPAFMQPVAMGLPTDFSAGDPVILAGYGRIIPKGSKAPYSNPGLLYQVETRISQIYPEPPLEGRVTQDLFGLIQFKSDDGVSGGCQGDSGGPMYLQKNGELLVIGSTVGGPGVCAATGIYSNLSQYAPWVRETAQKI